MTNKQFEQVMAAQLCQIALLHTIETNTAIAAGVSLTPANARIDWGAAKTHLDEAMKQREQAAIALKATKAAETEAQAQAGKSQFEPLGS